jgi:Spy/CpxP family protein refolding chaperone
MTQSMRWRMLGYMIALFIAGAITGAAVISRSSTSSQTLKIGRTEEIASLIRQKMDPLNLTGEQDQKISPLIRSASEQLEASHLLCLQQCSTIIDKLHAQMAPVLTPEQREKLKQLEADRREVIRKKYNFTDLASSTNHP